jgi:hypothetical protein
MTYKEYNGWTNWDTWNSYNWLTESEGPYNMARRTTGPNELRQLFIELFEPTHDDIDVDEVNWDELYESFND